MNTNRKISVIVPLFNEAQSVAFLYQELLLALKSLSCPFEIIIVDDGSGDGTFEEIRFDGMEMEKHGALKRRAKTMMRD